MKALSVRAGYIYNIMIGEKTVEYRSWQTMHRGDLLLVSSTNPLYSAQSDEDGEWYDYSVKGILPLGQALCVINLTDCEKMADKDFHWHFDNVRMIEPFPVKGKLHLFDVDEKIKYIDTIEEVIGVWIEKNLVNEEMVRESLFEEE